MIPPRKIREEIADRMIRIVAPTTTLGMLLVTVIILLMGSQQYLRLIPASLTIVVMAPAWLCVKKGKPLLGAKILLIFVSVAIIIGMILNGGSRAPAYLSTMSFITIVTIVYGVRTGFFYALGTISIGLLFAYLEHSGIIPKAVPPPVIYIVMILGVCLFVQIVFISIPLKMMLIALDKSQIQGQELEKAIHEKQDSQTFLQSILDKTPDIIFRVDTKGKIIFINNAVRQYGLTPDVFLDKKIINYIHPEDRIKAEKAFENPGTKDRPPRSLELRVFSDIKHSIASDRKKLQKGWRIFSTELEDIYFDETISRKNYAGIQGIAKDISRAKYLEKQSNRLAVIVEQAADAIIITDTEGIVRYVNPKFESEIGYLKSEIIGETISVLSSDKHERGFYTELWTDIKKGNVWNGKIWNKKKNGNLILHDVSISPILNAEDKIIEFATIHRDITDQQKLEDRMRQSQKMEAIGTLAGGVAHDFNNILGAIIGYAELAQYDLEDENPAKESVHQILQAGQRAKDLAKQILLFSRRTEQEMVPVKITILIKEVVTLLMATLPSTIKIDLDFQSENRVVLANPGQIHQVLMNLCTNAAQALGDMNGKITIKLDQFVLDQEVTLIYPELPIGNYLKLQVIDTGSGISSNDIDKIFDPFFTTKSRGEGTGLGLSVVHGILENHHGTIRVSSKLDMGTTFDIYLPILESDTLYSTKSEVVINKGDGQILFVDDEASLVEIGKKLLERHGYNVTPAFDGQEAWKIFSKNPDRFDVIITDKTMPKMTGIELSKQIHSIRPKIPILLSTGFSEEITIDQANTIGIRQILNKPVISSELLTAIQKII